MRILVKRFEMFSSFGLLGMLLTLVVVNGCKSSDPEGDGQGLDGSSLATAGGAGIVANFGDSKSFFFGSALAPAHAEDQLDDGWLEFAKEGKVAAFKNEYLPEERIQFWSKPEVEIDLVIASGSKVLRLGVDWQRLTPKLPGSQECGRPCASGVQDFRALGQYKKMIQYARSKGLRVMVTLFHHSLPKWAMQMGGWPNPEITPLFVAFGEDVIREFAGEVDDWITLNEPMPFLLFTYVAGIWPGSHGQSAIDLLDLGGIFEGKFAKGFDNMVAAHRTLYSRAHELDLQVANPGLPSSQSARVGIAHNVAISVASRPVLDALNARIFSRMVGFDFPDSIVDQLDFLGLNYYGKEILKGSTVDIDPNFEYSATGRSIYPNGLFEILMKYHQHYNSPERQGNGSQRHSRTLRFIITENGVADAEDILRPSYLIEHLMAVAAARSAGVPVLGYLNWTTSDNMEWAFGYCAKFGLAAVDRKNGFKRQPRPSFQLFRDIATSGLITENQREGAWSKVRSQVGKNRTFCVAEDGKTPLDTPRVRPVSGMDWRFKL